MSVFVVDASVGIKWFIPEVHTPDALRLRDPHRMPLFSSKAGGHLIRREQR
jgi:hypothetical protein